MRVHHRLILTISIMLCSHMTWAASFDCASARLSTEKQICQVRSLSDADVKLSTTYYILLKAVPMGFRDQQKSQQSIWLKSRNDCQKNTKCIAKAYYQRQAELDQLLQQRVLSKGPF